MMTSDITIYNDNDGFADAAADYSENLLRGELLKCTDGHWFVGKEGSALAHDTRMVALGTAASWVKWVNGKPDEFRIRRAGETMLERDELGDNVAADWETGPDGQPRDPWQNTRFLWLVDPKTAAAYTFSTSSWSGRSAVIGLGDQITRMRVARPGVNPIIEFSSAPLQTKFGRKMKPVLKIVGWVGGGGEGADVKQIGKAPAKAEVLDDMMDDACPF
jgi:hypothetical protein